MRLPFSLHWEKYSLLPKFRHYSHWCLVSCQLNVNLYNNNLSWALFHVSICHLYVLFSKKHLVTSSQIFIAFLIFLFRCNLWVLYMCWLLIWYALCECFLFHLHFRFNLCFFFYGGTYLIWYRLIFIVIFVEFSVNWYKSKFFEIQVLVIPKAQYFHS